MQDIENIIIRNLLYNDEYSSKVYPFLDAEYFDGVYKSIWSNLSTLVETYHKVPTMEALLHELKKSDLPENDFNVTLSTLEDIYKSRKEQTDVEWLVKETEEYCSNKATFNAIYKSIEIIEGNDKNLTKHSIPDILENALSVSFNTDIGSDYFEDVLSRYEHYINTENKLPFRLKAVNRLMNGGLPPKTLSAVLAFCVHPETEITVKLDNVIKVIKIKEAKDILSENRSLFVDSPDGFVRVTDYIHKGLHNGYKVTIPDDIFVKCSTHHRFETNIGWVSACDLDNSKHTILTKKGYKTFNIQPLDKPIEIVDITVDHPNHRYYTNGLSSHNTNVGKSSLMCSMSSDFLRDGKNVLYISMEMSEEAVHQRIDANLLDVTTDELDNKSLNKDWFLSSVKKMKEKGYGRLIVKQYPTSTAHAGHFKTLLKELKMKRKFKPDIIFVDYINICASSRYKSMTGVNSYSYIKAIAEELRALAVEFELPIFTATQVNREGGNSSSPDMTNTSECLDFYTIVEEKHKGKIYLKDIEVGDELKAHDGYKVVRMVHCPKIKKSVKIKLKSGKEIICSKDHVFPSSKGRLSINQGLSIGDRLSTITGSLDING